MIDFLHSLLEARNLVTILVAMAAFATVVTLTAPLLQGDKLQDRMKTLATERDRLRTQNRQALVDKDNRRLRDNGPKGAAAQIVDALNLKKILEAETSRKEVAAGGAAVRETSDDLPGSQGNRTCVRGLSLCLCILQPCSLTRSPGQCASQQP